ncbi:hypothetical protein [Paenibacillus sp. y28]|uniref:hypothetical protein n=1 Tax=Paenibacillus sp. y28 TaxID=3129110 RepID=UPI003016AA68
MPVQMIALFIVYTSILAYDIPRLKQCRSPERIAYWLLMLASLYLGMDFVFKLHWPNPTSIVKDLLDKPSMMILKS